MPLFNRKIMNDDDKIFNNICGKNMPIIFSKIVLSEILYTVGQYY